MLLQQNRARVTFTGVARAGGRELKPDKTYVARVKGGGVALTDSKGKAAGEYGAPVSVGSDDGFRLGGTSINGVTNGTSTAASSCAPRRAAG